MKSTLCISILLIILIGCAVQPGYTKITPQEYDELAAQEDTVVIDVHVPEQEQLPNTDYVISYLNHEALQEAIPSKDTPVVVYCRSGSMSEHTAQDLVEAGYTNIYELNGGRNAYIQ